MKNSSSNTKRTPFILSILALPLWFVKIFTIFIIGCSFFPVYIWMVITSYIILHSCFNNNNSNNSKYIYLLLFLPRWLLGHISFIIFLLPTYFLVYLSLLWTRNEPLYIQYIICSTFIIIQLGAIILGFSKVKYLTRKLSLPLISWKDYCKSIIISNLDIIIMIFCCFICIFIIQIYSLYKWITNDKGLQKIPFRTYILVQFVLTILNIICIIPFCILILLPWRLYYLYSLEKQKYQKYPFFIEESSDILTILRSNMWKSYLYTRAIIIIQGIHCIIDIPFIILGFLITCTIWRAETMWKHLLNMKKHESLYSIIYKQFIKWIIDIPFVLLSIILLCSILKSYITYQILYDAKKCKINASITRLLIGDQFISLFLDIFSFIILLLAFISSWHSSESYRLFKDYKFSGISSISPGYGIKWNCNVFTLGIHVIIDIPFIILSFIILTTIIYTKLYWDNLLSLNTLHKSYSKYCNTRRRITIEFTLCLLLQPFSYLIFSLVYITRLELSLLSYHLNIQYKELKTPIQPYSLLYIQYIILKQYIIFILDIFYHICTLCITLSIVRAYNLYKKLYIIRNTLKTSKNITIQQINDSISIQKSIILEEFICLLLDIPKILSIIIIYTLNWRKLDYSIALDDTKTIINNNNKVKLYHYEHLTAIRYAFYSITDIPAILSFLIVFFTYYRYSELQKKQKYYKQQYGIMSDNFHSNWNYSCILSLFMILIDIIVVITSPFIILLIFHAKTFIRKVKKAQDLELHRLCIKYFILSFLDFPFLILCTIIYIFHWRYSIFWNEVENISKENSQKWLKLDSRRLASIRCIILIILDIFSFITKPIILLIGWNNHEIQEIRKHPQTNINDIINNQISILQLFIILLLDIPFIIGYLIISCSWKRKSFKNTLQLRIRNRRYVIIEYILCLCIDFPALISYYSIMIQKWRVYSFTTRLNQIELNRKVYEKLGRFITLEIQLLKCIYGILSIFDIPFSILALIIYFSWRRNNIKELLSSTQSDKRFYCFILFFIVLTDIPTWILYNILIYTKWYKSYLLKELENYKDNENTTKKQHILNIIKYNITCIWCFIKLLFDIPTLICLLFVYCTFIRKHKLIGDLIKYDIDMISKRIICWKHLYFVFIDIIVFIERLFLYITLWRQKECLKIENMTSSKALYHCSKHCIRLIILDIPFIILFSVIYNTWRKSSILSQYSFCDTYHKKRIICFRYFIILFLDIILVYMSIIILIGSLFFNSNILLKELIKGYKLSIELEQKHFLSQKEYLIIHKNIFMLFGYVLWNIPYTLLSCILYIFHWRWNTAQIQKHIITDILSKQGSITIPNNPSKNNLFYIYWKILNTILIESLLYIIIDIICLIPMIICLCSWRGKRTYKSLKKEYNESFFKLKSMNEKQKQIISKQIKCYFNLSSLRIIKTNPHIFTLEIHSFIFYESIQLLLDIPFIILLSCLFWRFPYTIKNIWKYNQLDISIRLFIFKQFIGFIGDIPYFILFVCNILCFWKYKWNIITIFYISWDTNTLRKFISCCFISNLKDILCTIFGLFIGLTLWRLPRLLKLLFHYLSFSLPSKHDIKLFLSSNGSFLIHDAIYEELNEWFKDIPYIPCFFILFLSPYRLYCYISFLYGKKTFKNRLDTVQHCKQVLRTWRCSDDFRIYVKGIQIGSKFEYKRRNNYNNACRIVLFASFIMTIEDISIIGLCLLSLFSGWRTINFLEELYESPTKKTLLRQCRYFCKDILSLFNIFIIIIFIVRIPGVIYAFWNIYKESKRRGDRIFLLNLYIKKIKNIFSSKKQSPNIPSQDLHFTHLPNEILFEIACKLSYKDICNLQQSCKQFLWLDDQELWKIKLQETAPHKVNDKDENISYKMLFKQHILQEQTNLKDSYYTLGCRKIINHAAYKSFFEMYHTFLIPIKLLHIFCIFIDYYVRKFYPFVWNNMKLRAHFSFWHAHELEAFLHSITYIYRLVVLSYSIIIMYIEYIYWRIGKGYINEQWVLWRYIRIIQVLPYLLFSFCIIIHPIIFYIYYPIIIYNRILFIFIFEIIMIKVYSIRYFPTPNTYRIAKVEFHAFCTEESAAFKRFKVIIKNKIKSFWNRICQIGNTCNQKINSVLNSIYKKCCFIGNIIWKYICKIYNKIKDIIINIIWNYIYKTSLAIYNFVYKICTYIGYKIYCVLVYIINYITNIIYKTLIIIGYYIRLIALTTGNIIYKIIMKILKILATIFAIIQNIFKRIIYSLYNTLKYILTIFINIYSGYNNILAKSTKTCSKLPPLLGNIILIPICLIWIFWPCCIALYYNYLLLIPSIIITGFLLQKGYRIIDKNWI